MRALRFICAITAVSANIQLDTGDVEGLALLQVQARKRPQLESPPSASLAQMEDEKGHDVRRRVTPDGATNIEFVDRGAGPFDADGILSGAQFYVQRAGNLGLRFRIYRPSGGGFSLVGQTEAISMPQGGVQEVTFAEPVEFAAGDYIGWAHDGNGNIPFDGNGGRVSWEYNKNNAVGVSRGFRSGGARTYSYKCITKPIEDEAEAVADPHMTTNTGKNFDLSMAQQKLQDEVKGHGVQRRVTPDGATNIEFVDRGAGPFNEDGILSSGRFYVQRAGNLGLRFRIYRPSGGGFSLVGQTEAIDMPQAGVIQEVTFAEPVEFAAGDYIGWAHDGNGNIPFDGNGGRVSWEYNKNNAVGVSRGFGSGGARTYSYEMSTKPIADEADAAGDPHITTNSGKHFDIGLLER